MTAYPTWGPATATVVAKCWDIQWNGPVVPVTQSDRKSLVGVNRANWLTVLQQYRLSAACLDIARVFNGNCPYLVGSVLERADYHDVDVRMMLPDKDFKRMFHNRTWLLKANALISAELECNTGLPIDFQFQDTTQTNLEFTGPRHALGMWYAK